MKARDVNHKVAALDWPAIGTALDGAGVALMPELLSVDDCRMLSDIYAQDEAFRSRVVMAQHGFGQGEYRYFGYPLPELVLGLRTALYSRLSATANRWQAIFGHDARFPEMHSDYLERCHSAGQTRPTPLLLRYGEGDYNRLHQDIYGEHVFPLQVTVLLSAPGEDFTGGEFVLTEQRARMQSRAEVVSLAQGDAVIFPTRQRPAIGARGMHWVMMRHGVSRVRRGQRTTLGIIFHDAE